MNSSELFPCALTGKLVLDQLQAITRVASSMGLTREMQPSRSAARKLAESLAFAMSSDEAETMVRESPIGTVSFLRLANEWKRGISPEGAELVSRQDGIRPYDEVTNWFLSCLNFNEKNWLPEKVADDSYGFSD